MQFMLRSPVSEMALNYFVLYGYGVWTWFGSMIGSEHCLVLGFLADLYISNRYMIQDLFRCTMSTHIFMDLLQVSCTRQVVCC
jgi:hypothetical protein